MKYLAVLGRESEISIAELQSLFGEVKQIAPELAVFNSNSQPDINRLGGTIKLGQLLDEDIIHYLLNLNISHKLTIGVSDYSKNGSKNTAMKEALKIKRILTKNGKSVRILQNNDAVLSSATVHHNQLGEKPGNIEIIIVGKEYYIGIGVQNITAYKDRDQARPARDAKVGMLPPKLAQILINLCGPLKNDVTILDPFCGTGVVLQEAALMGYNILGTDKSDRMIEYTSKNLKWLKTGYKRGGSLEQLGDIEKKLSVGDATDFSWQSLISQQKLTQTIDAVACETYLGAPMHEPPVEAKLRDQKLECRTITTNFLKNLASQIKSGTPVVIAVPAWLRPNGSYETMNILDDCANMGYNVSNIGRKSSLLYFREGQIVAREIIVLRKK